MLLILCKKNPRALITAGARRLALVARRRDRLEKAGQECGALGAEQVLLLDRDLSDLAACQEIVKSAVEEFGSELKHAPCTL